MTPTLISVIPQAGLHFALYNFFSVTWKSIISLSVCSCMLGFIYLPHTCNHNLLIQELVKTRATICGALAGITTKSLLLPLDVIKKRLQVDCNICSDTANLINMLLLGTRI
jgi:hypothetical protein